MREHGNALDFTLGDTIRADLALPDDACCGDCWPVRRPNDQPHVPASEGERRQARIDGMVKRRNDAWTLERDGRQAWDDELTAFVNGQAR